MLCELFTSSNMLPDLSISWVQSLASLPHITCLASVYKTETENMAVIVAFKLLNIFINTLFCGT